MCKIIKRKGSNGKLAFCQLNYSRSSRHLKYSKINRLRARPKSPSLRIPDSPSCNSDLAVFNSLGAILIGLASKMDSKAIYYSKSVESTQPCGDESLGPIGLGENP